MKYILAIIIFGVIILIHEFGHFFTAKLCGIKVNKFALGMGPCLLKKQFGETEYSIRLFPVGGFCAMEGEDEDSDNSRAFGNKPVWQRMIVIVAGAFMNILLGFVLVLSLTCSYEKIPTTTVSEFHSSSESAKSGILPGDKIVNIDGVGILTVKDLRYALMSSPDEKYDVTVKRNGEKIKFSDVVFEDKANNLVIDFYVGWKNKTPLSVVSYSAKDTVSTAKLVWLSLKDLITGKYSFRDLSGPVGLVNAIGDAADSGESTAESVQSIVSLAALITINLGIVNLLPIPGLDGGRFLFLLIEAIRRKPVKPEHEGTVHLIGMALLMLMIVAVTFSDIKRIIG